MNEDASLKALCQALRVVFTLLKPQQRPIAFVLLIGRLHQGKTTLLKQSGLQVYPLPDAEASLYYNQEGVVLELCESWLNQTSLLLSAVLKQLNRVHSAVRISGLALCIDSQGFVDVEHEGAKEEALKQLQWLKRFQKALGYSVDVSLFFTKSDVMTGFIPFFQSEYPDEFLKPLGFSLEGRLPMASVLKQYRQKYDRLVENLTRQILPKLHAVRSSVLRTMIREFPLQLASLKAPLQAFLDVLLKEGVKIRGVYWMSADSRQHHVDRLQTKISHEYGLVPQTALVHFRPQPAYFVQGAIENVLLYTKRVSYAWPTLMRGVVWGIAGMFLMALVFLVYEHLHAKRLLDDTSEELLAYDLLSHAGQQPTAAAYHLTQALHALKSVPYPMRTLPTVTQLQAVLDRQTSRTLQSHFLPQLLSTLEQRMRSPQATPVARYNALKTYLRLVEPAYFSAPAIREWFTNEWQQFPPASPEKASALLNELLTHPVKIPVIDQGLISEVRNYLNALPVGYFYYSLAKPALSHQTVPLQFSGLVLSTAKLPVIYTKSGFSESIHTLQKSAAQLSKENWVLGQDNPQDLADLLLQAYCFEYVTFWKQWMQQTHLATISDFQAGQLLAAQLMKDHSFSKIIELVRTQTSVLPSGNKHLFNEYIASKFTAFHFLSQRAIHDLDQAVKEIEHFLSTLAIVHDEGQTAFAFTKARFQGEMFSDSLSLLAQRANSLPQPMSTLVKQLSDAVWSMLIQQSRHYLNTKWYAVVYQPYEKWISHRFPFDVTRTEEVSLKDFEAFFAPQGLLGQFVEDYVKPFLDMSAPQWKVKTRDGLMMPIAEDTMSELIRANVISNMFFTKNNPHGHIDFSLEKVTLDPVVSRLSLTVGQSALHDDQASHTNTEFSWPATHAMLTIDAVNGGHFTLEEQGVWAFFKMLQKVNVLVDSEDAGVLQILFEVNGNTGRYMLRTQNQINPFSPGILDGFILKKALA